MAKLCVSLQPKNLENTTKFGKLENFFKNSLKIMELFWSLRVLYMRKRIFAKVKNGFH